MTEEILDRKQVCELLKIARSTLYERLRDDPTFPRPVSRARARLKFKRSDIEQWQKAQEAQRPENRERSQRELEALAHSPRRGEREKRRAQRPPQAASAAPIYAYEPTPLESIEQRLQSVHEMPSEDRRLPRYGSRPFRACFRPPPSLGW